MWLGSGLRSCLGRLFVFCHTKASWQDADIEILPPIVGGRIFFVLVGLEEVAPIGLEGGLDALSAFQGEPVPVMV